MKRNMNVSWVVLALVLGGCGSSQPEHAIQPIKALPPVKNAFKDLKTPEEKIKFVENSRAPENAKQDAIARIKAGQL